MADGASQPTGDCRSIDIASYIDGELSPVQEAAIEHHLAGCPSCTAELNEQKFFLCALSSSLDREHEIELPKDFTKVVVAAAESSVCGVRRPSELFNALFICSALFFFILFALGPETGRTFSAVTGVLAEISALAVFVGHVVFDLATGVIIVLRSLGTGLAAEPVARLAVPVTVGIIVAVLSRKIFRSVRA